MAEPKRHFEKIEAQADERDDWARRRRKGIPTNKKLMVVACMDERIPIEEALGFELGDAHIFRNAGGKVTDDVIRSAVLSTHFFDTEEIIIVNHTDCGMMSASDEAVREGLQEAAGEELEEVPLNPALPELELGEASLLDWVNMTEDIDQACQEQVDLLRGHPLIPDAVAVRGYVYEVESGALRRPGERLGEAISVRAPEKT